jgi:hypothetical protein
LEEKGEEAERKRERKGTAYEEEEDNTPWGKEGLGEQ